MNFSEALEELKKGKKIKRQHWGGFWFIPLDITIVNEKYNDADATGMIVAKLKEGSYAPAQAYQSDLLANDWEVIE